MRDESGARVFFVGTFTGHDAQAGSGMASPAWADPVLRKERRCSGARTSLISGEECAWRSCHVGITGWRCLWACGADEVWVCGCVLLTLL